MLLIVDADALVAFSVKIDGNHSQAKYIIRKCQENSVHYIIPVTAVCEAVTVIHRKKASAEEQLEKLMYKVPGNALERQELERKRATAQNYKTAYTAGLTFFLQFVKNTRVKHQAIDREILLEAMEQFHVDGKATDTFFDAIIATLARRLGADGVFSFDHVYPTMGLSLARDLFL